MTKITFELNVYLQFTAYSAFLLASTAMMVTGTAAFDSAMLITFLLWIKRGNAS